jgi:hypothetical protein
MKNARFQVPRFGMPEQLLDLKQRVFGVEKAKLLLRKL